MTHKQWILVSSWIVLPALLAISFFVEPEAVVWIVAPVAVLALLYKDKLTAEYLAIPNVLEIYERSLLWKVVAFAYLGLLLAAIGYHFGIERLVLFEEPNLATIMIAVLLPVLGPLIAAQRIAFRNLGKGGGER